MAHARHATGRYPWVAGLHVMDAERLSFPDGAFDAVVAQFVITLVANPERVLDECARVLAPGGEIILVNHFHSGRGFVVKLEDGLAGVARPLGLRPEFPFARIALWAELRGDMRFVERRKIKPFKAVTLVRITETLTRRLAAGALPIASRVRIIVSDGLCWPDPDQLRRCRARCALSPGRMPGTLLGLPYAVRSEKAVSTESHRAAIIAPGRAVSDGPPRP